VSLTRLTDEYLEEDGVRFLMEDEARWHGGLQSEP
jgi:hypothetical protein